jgi:hypothetical protein
MKLKKDILKIGIQEFMKDNLNIGTNGKEEIKMRKIILIVVLIVTLILGFSIITCNCNNEKADGDEDGVYFTLLK